MANSVTLRNTVALRTGSKVLGDLYEYKITYDTGAGTLELRAATAGKYLILGGLGFGVSSNAGVKILSNSVEISGFAIAANHANPFTYEYGRIIAIGTYEQNLAIISSQAFTNNLGSAVIIEVDADQLAAYVGRT